MFRKKAAELTDKIKTEVGKAGEIVTAAIVLAAAALIVAVVAVIAVMIGARADAS